MFYLLDPNRVLNLRKSSFWPGLKDNSGVDMISAIKESYHLLTRILTVASHFELPNDYQVQKFCDKLGYVWSLRPHFHTSAHDRKASNCLEGREQ